MKTHKTIKITEKMLVDARACSQAIVELRPFLPLTISSDPVENMDLCAELFAHDVPVGEYRDKLYLNDITFLGYWAVEHLMNGNGNAVYDQTQIYRRPDQRAWGCAQQLAWVADALLTRAGK